ncbi:MAG: hypothetical protein ACPGWR_27600, partial [Ardenticatenaceae bacterium]
SGDHFLVPSLADFRLATLAWRKIRGECPPKVISAALRPPQTNSLCHQDSANGMTLTPYSQMGK